MELLHSTTMVISAGHRPAIFLRIIAILVLGIALTGCVFTPDKENSAQDKGVFIPTPKKMTAAATIGIEDVFTVQVYRHKDMSGDYRVAPDGSINFPLVGKVVVDGLTSSQVSELLIDKLSTYLKRPYVSVYIKEFNSKKIFVFGEVKKPGTFRYEDNMSVIQAITMAGGFTERAASNRTSVTRMVDGKEDQVVLPVEEIAEGKKKNFYLQAGDIIFVPQTYF